MKNEQEKLPTMLPWMQQDEEPTDEYVLFKRYLDLKDERSYVGVANDAHLSLRTIAEIGRNRKWVERARTFEKYINTHISFKYDYELNDLYNMRQRHNVEVIKATYKAEESLITLLENRERLYNDDYANKQIDFILKIGKALNLMRRMRKLDLPPEFKEQTKLLVNAIDKICTHEPDDELWDNPDDIELNEKEEVLEDYHEIKGPVGQVLQVYTKEQSKNFREGQKKFQAQLAEKQKLDNELRWGELPETEAVVVEPEPDHKPEKNKKPNLNGQFYEPILDPESDQFDPDASVEDFDRGEVYNKIRGLEGR